MGFGTSKGISFGTVDASAIMSCHVTAINKYSQINIEHAINCVHLYKIGGSCLVGLYISTYAMVVTRVYCTCTSCTYRDVSFQIFF